MLYQTAHFADGVIQFTLSLCELHPLLCLEHNPINQASLKQTSRVLLATIAFIGKDTNALRKLSLLYQLGQYHHIGTIGWRGNYALHQPLPIGQHVLFVPVAIVPAFAHPSGFRIDPWFATFQLILISLLLGLLFFGPQVLSVVCHFDEDTSIGSVRAIHVTTNLYTLEIPCNGLIFGSSFYLTSLDTTQPHPLPSPHR